MEPPVEGYVTLMLVSWPYSCKIYYSKQHYVEKISLFQVAGFKRSFFDYKQITVILACVIYNNSLLGGDK